MSDIMQVTGTNYASQSASRSAVTVGSREFDNTLGADELARIEEQVRTANYLTSVDTGRDIKQAMGKDDFLRLLIVQLQNQDPTKPMEDREFIAQMAQFSSLEQMTNLSQNFERLSNMMTASHALGVLGREVDIVANGEMITGRVAEVTQGEYPQVLVGDRYYDFSAIERVKDL